MQTTAFKRGDGGLNNSAWRTMAYVTHIRAERDENGCSCHAGRLSATTMPAQPTLTPEPAADCRICPRLADYRRTNRAAHPDWFNAPVPSWGDPAAWLLIVGLAPGVQGANRTGRPFTGDYAGDLLYATLQKFKLAQGDYLQRADDGLTLKGCFISNAVRCVPPENKPTPAEIHSCRPFLVDQIKSLPRLKVMIALGTIAHQSALKALGAKLPKYPFGHNSVHVLPNGVTLIDSYHCSRYNTNTKRLTTDMFEAVFEKALLLAAPHSA
jgi:uracil-DNA glycosylase